MKIDWISGILGILAFACIVPMFFVGWDLMWKFGIGFGVSVIAMLIYGTIKKHLEEK